MPDNTGPPSDSILALDEAKIRVIVDNETDTLSSVNESVPQVPEVIQLAARLPASRTHQGHAGKVVFDKLCCACHGFSALVSGRSGEETHTMLFDVGPYPDVWLRNAQRLDVDLAAIECVFLSHWHFDHSGALPEVIAAISQARKAVGMDEPLLVDLHPNRPDQRGVLLPSGQMLLLPEEPRFDALISAGGEVVTHSAPHALCKVFFFGSGAIERVTSYETGLAGHHTFRGDHGMADPLIMDERFIAVRVKGRGVTVLSACSHAGIVNACLGAQQQFPSTPIDLVIGGYHLAGKAMEARIEPTVRDLAQRICPRVVAPGHCTGWRAKHALADAFSPERYGPSVVGALYHLISQPA